MYKYAAKCRKMKEMEGNKPTQVNGEMDRDCHSDSVANDPC